MHKALLPLDASDIAAFVAMVVGGSISFVGGIGGGGIFVPIFLLAGKFSLHEAVPLSKSAIFVGAAMTTLLNLCKEHPTEERPLIDFDAATLFLPSVLAGTSVGVLLNVVLPWVSFFPKSQTHLPPSSLFTFLSFSLAPRNSMKSQGKP